MKSFDLAEYMFQKGKSLSDKLWNKGKEFTLFDENNKPVQLEEYGSYANLYHNFGGSVEHAYSDYNENIDEYGSRRKLFFRVQSEFFKELIEEKKNNPNCSYVTNVDELLEDGFIPEKLSAILQEEFPGRVAFQAVEKIGAKMLNFFSVPTIYCGGLAYKEAQNSTQVFTVSPDFLKPNEIMMNLNEYMQQYVYKDDCKYIKDQTLEEFTSCYKKILKAHYKKVKESGFEVPDKKYIDQKLNQWKENLCYMMLVKKYALGDGDFLARNLGVVVNTKTNDINLAPAFDLELMGNHVDDISGKFLYDFIFEKEFGDVDLRRFIEDYLFYHSEDKGVKDFIDDIKFIQKNCPQVLTKFIKKADDLLVSVDDGPCKLDAFLQEFCKDAIENGDQDEQYKEDFKDYFKLVRDVCDVYASKENEAEMSE